MPGIDELGGFGKSATAHKVVKPERISKINDSAPEHREARGLSADVQQAMLRSMQGETDNAVMKFKVNDLVRGALIGCEKALDVKGDSQIMRIAILHLHKTLTGEWPQPVSKKKLTQWLKPDR
jgi:hypothetical protein